MTDEQKAAYVHAQVALLNAEVAAFEAENTFRQHRGEVIACGEKEFADLLTRYEVTIGHNAVIALFREQEGR